MDKLEKMQASLNKNLPVSPAAETHSTPAIVIDKDVKDDYEFSRATYRDLIRTGTSSLEPLAELARESEHPRAFEVLSKSIKDIADTTEKLMALQKAKKELTVGERKAEEAREVTNNNIFVGSTTELQRLLKADRDRVINAENQE